MMVLHILWKERYRMIRILKLLTRPNMPVNPMLIMGSCLAKVLTAQYLQATR